MKFRSSSLVLILSLLISFMENSAFANEKPVVQSFTVEPANVEITGTNTQVQFNLQVSHPFGIHEDKVEITITNDRKDSYKTVLYRTDNPVVPQLKNVVFKGTFEFPRNSYPGVYKFESSSISNNDSAGYSFETGVIPGPNLRAIQGAESGILITKFGNLDMDFDTFVGPTYEKWSGISFEDTRRFNSGVSPVWRVNEIYNPNTYFELRVKSLRLEIVSETPRTCVSDENILKFVSEGNCTFTVFTSATKFYKEKRIKQSYLILPKKKKIELFVQDIPSLNSENLPKTIELTPVLGGPNIYVMPVSKTPLICFATDLKVTILSGGTCLLLYKTLETEEYESSEYVQKIEVTRRSQAIDFNLPNRISLSIESIPLSAMATSGEKVNFESKTMNVCRIQDNTLSFLRAGSCEVSATQIGNSLYSPTSVNQSIEVFKQSKSKNRKITCRKGDKILIIKGLKPKCPREYSRA